jgi:hypothetical protein
MSDSHRTSSAWRAAHARGTAPSRAVTDLDEDPRVAVHPPAWLSFRDFAAVQIAATAWGSGPDLSHRETAEVAYDLAQALDEERARRHARRDRDDRAPHGDGPAV